MAGTFFINCSMPMHSNTWSYSVVIATIQLLIISCVLVGNTKADPQYVGGAACKNCHADEYQQWQGSHHDWAMREASSDTVLGDFDNTRFSHQGITTHFTTVNGEYFARTENKHGKQQTFKIAYTFGFEPLQQYLIGFPDGRYQALTVAWDSRPEEQGGQRWYQLMPNDMGQPGESLHWTGVYYNWNTQCAECHSTGLEKNYHSQTNSYSTTWSEVNVSCESCHGPGSDHSVDPSQPLPVEYSAQMQWVIAEGATIANSIGDPHQGAQKEINSCAGCHSRRAKISDDPVNNHSAGDTYLDHYQPQLLRQGLYHADGQIQDEVYVYGSFVQSKMYQRGVRCSNCHEPHSLKLKADGNQVCASCHAPQAYDNPSHHFHNGPDNPGAQCVNCHMPETTYMGIDNRRDHSMRIPRPLLAEKVGAPNACNVCHADQTPSWAGSAIAQWANNIETKISSPSKHHNGVAIAAGREGWQSANQQLIALANDASSNPMARATALTLLNTYPNRDSYQAAQRRLSDPNPLVRIGAIEALEFLAPDQRWNDLSPLLDDKVKAVRLAATARLLGTQQASKNARLQANIAEYIASLQVNADRPNSQLQLASAYTSLGRYQQADQAYQQALMLEPLNAVAINNRADSFRAQGLHQRALELLVAGNKTVPNNPLLLHSLGLAQVRSGQPALDSLRQAANLAPDNNRYSYIYAIALNGDGKTKQAIEVLERALETSPIDRDLLIALVTINRDHGNLGQARLFARRLADAFPQDSAAKRLLNSL